jgi:hypothetical protein
MRRIRSLHVVATASAALWASAAMAQPFVAVNIAPSPDTLYAFDPANPAAAVATPPLATLEGNFIRGFDMDGPTTGWYVATAPLSGSPTGIYRYSGGVSTFVALLPFDSTAVGGLSLSADRSFMYWVADPPDAVSDDTLYRIDFNGTVTALTPITLAGQPVIVINAIAVHPTTGAIYASESNSDSILTINPVTGVATALGASGVAIGAVGGMDFDTRSGSLIFVNGRNVHTVDTATGVATLIGQLPVSNSSVASVPDACISDYNGDNAVNSGDISAFLTAWLASVQMGNLDADFNADGAVNSGDISAFLTAWLDEVQNGC